MVGQVSDLEKIHLRGLQLVVEKTPSYALTLCSCTWLTAADVNNQKMVEKREEVQQKKLIGKETSCKASLVHDGMKL